MVEDWGKGGKLYVEGEQAKRPYITVFVCQGCNDWMNQTFEVPTRRLLDQLSAGQRVVLTPGAQVLLAGYMTKMLLMLNLWHRSDRDPYLTTEIYRRFRGLTEFPSGTEIWLSQVVEADPVREQSVVGAIPELREGYPPPPRAFPLGSSVHIWTFSNLVVTWLRVVQGVPSGWPDPRELLNPARAVGLTVPIWPPQLPYVTWPPKLILDIPTYERWNLRFGYIG